MEQHLRVCYHTHIKALVREGLLSTSVLKQIPRSNLYRWRAEPQEKYKDFGLILNAEKDYETLKSFAQDRSAKRIYAAYVRIISAVLSIAHSLTGFHQEIQAQRIQFVDLVNKVKNIVGLRKTLRILNISVHTFRNWSLQSATECFESQTQKCYRVYHNQLSRPEVVKLKHMLTDKQFQYWPVSSIALFALRENILPLSLNTWYKYVHKLGLKRLKTSSRRKKSEVSIRADHPHQIWHADISQFVTADHVRHFIYVVVDNFSRKILSWCIKDCVKAVYRRGTIEAAVNEASRTGTTITLITDGGPENKLEHLVESLYPRLEHKVALADVHYSNSLVEAAFKTIKYNYLYRMELSDYGALTRAMDFIVKDFNGRPHISLGGLTPNEAAQQRAIDNEQHSLHKRVATEARKQYNKSNRCKMCTELG